MKRYLIALAMISGMLPFAPAAEATATLQDYAHPGVLCRAQPNYLDGDIRYMSSPAGIGNANRDNFNTIDCPIRARAYDPAGYGINHVQLYGFKNARVDDAEVTCTLMIKAGNSTTILYVETRQAPAVRGNFTLDWANIPQGGYIGSIECGVGPNILGQSDDMNMIYAYDVGVS
jgi:hypothetical protein